MTIASNQPYFIPYLAYWQLIHAADRFLIADDFAYRRKGWINRNRILIAGKPQWFRVEVRHPSSFRLICDTEIMPIDIPEKLKTLDMAYHKAPYFAEGFALMERILSFPERNLSAFLEFSIREVCTCLGITTPIGHTSDLPGNCLFRREERIYDFCRRLNADTYINAIGGQELYRFDAFARQGLRLRFLHSTPPPYRQSGGPFVEKLSILDAVMFNPPERLHALLDAYSFIDG